MNLVFAFFLRLFICFVAAKLVVQAVDLNSRDYLLALTVLFLVNAYLFDWLVYRNRRPVKGNQPEGDPDETPEKPPSENGA
jgi:hypothetical protein